MTATSAKPDLDFKRRMLKIAGDDLSACYQCGTCSVVCDLSTDDNPFPRKEMVLSQWGLKERALSNPSIWLCHQCGTCSTYCPRNARPADVMAALRDESIVQYSRPEFMTKALRNPAALPILFAIPAVLILIVLGFLGNLSGFPEGTVVYSKFLPTTFIDVIFLSSVTLTMTLGVLGGLRYWRAMDAARGKETPKKGLVDTVMTILGHDKFAKCNADPNRTRESHSGHLNVWHRAAFWGFMGLFATTNAVMIGLYVFGVQTPYSYSHPIKWLGNASGVLLGVALLVMAGRRIANNEGGKSRSNYSDWLFIWVMFLTVVTGFAAQFFRSSGLAPEICYPTYFVHLLFVFFLIVYIPYSKFAHLVYRTVALWYAASVIADVPEKPAELEAEGAEEGEGDAAVAEGAGATS